MSQFASSNPFGRSSSAASANPFADKPVARPPVLGGRPPIGSKAPAFGRPSVPKPMFNKPAAKAEEEIAEIITPVIEEALAPLAAAAEELAEAVLKETVTEEVTEEIVQETSEEVVAEIEPVIEEEAKQTVEEIIEEAIENIATEEAEAAEPAAVVTTEVTTEELISDITNAETEVLDVPETVEDKPKKRSSSRSSRRKAKSKTEEAKVETEAAEEATEEAEKEASLVEFMYSMPRTNMTFAQAVNAIGMNFVDEEWNNFRENIMEELDAIVFEADMTDTAMKKMIAKLDTLRMKIYPTYGDLKSQMKQLASKEPEGLISRVKSMNYEGKNEMDRKRNSVIAVMNFKDPNGDTINLYEVYDELNARFTFADNIMDTIKFKHEMLMLMYGGIKLEKSVAR